MIKISEIKVELAGTQLPEHLIFAIHLVAAGVVRVEGPPLVVLHEGANEARLHLLHCHGHHRTPRRLQLLLHKEHWLSSRSSTERPTGEFEFCCSEEIKNI